MLEPFFAALFGRFGKKYLPYIEIRALAPKWMTTNVKALSKWAYSVGEAVAIVEMLQQSHPKYNLFFGVLPRAARYGIRDNIKKGATVWVDIDAKDVGDKNSTYDLLDSFTQRHGLRPSIVVDSGNGIHAYWLLAEMQGNPDGIELINEEIAKRVGGDSTTDAPRILRIPGTKNWKNEQEPIECKIVSIDNSAIYIPSDFPGYVFSDSVPRQGRKKRLVCEAPSPVELSLDSVEDRLSPLWRSYLKLGIKADTRGFYKNDRSRLDFAFICELIRRKFTVNEIYSIMMNPEYGISGKVLESNERYLQYTIEKAIAFVGE